MIETKIDIEKILDNLDKKIKAHQEAMHGVESNIQMNDLIDKLAFLQRLRGALTFMEETDENN